VNRLAKQLLFGGIYLAILFGVLYGGYRLFTVEATCTDGIQNGGEDGVDCGARACGRLCPPPVQPLAEPKVEVLENSDGSYDILVTLENPNAAYGVKRVDYTLTAASAVRRGFTYVNPAQPRHLLFPMGKLGTAPVADLQLASDSIEWAALAIDAAGSVEFAVRGDTLTAATASVRYEALVANRSRFDFDSVDITVLLYDSSRRIVGAGSTVVRTLLANEERGFVVDWPFTVPGVVRAEAFIGTNLFSNENYLRTYGSPDRIEGN
jgi:hypothetical protein